MDWTVRVAVGDHAARSLISSPSSSPSSSPARPPLERLAMRVSVLSQQAGYLRVATQRRIPARDHTTNDEQRTQSHDEQRTRDQTTTI